MQSASQKPFYVGNPGALPRLDLPRTDINQPVYNLSYRHADVTRELVMVDHPKIQVTLHRAVGPRQRVGRSEPEGGRYRNRAVPEAQHVAAISELVETPRSVEAARTCQALRSPVNSTRVASGWIAMWERDADTDQFDRYGVQPMRPQWSDRRRRPTEPIHPLLTYEEAGERLSVSGKAGRCDLQALPAASNCALETAAPDRSERSGRLHSAPSKGVSAELQCLMSSSSTSVRR